MHNIVLSENNTIVMIAIVKSYPTVDKQGFTPSVDPEKLQ